MSSPPSSAHERRRHEALEALTQGDFARAAKLAQVLLVLDPADQTAREVLAEASAELDVQAAQTARTNHSDRIAAVAGVAEVPKSPSIGPSGKWELKATSTFSLPRASSNPDSWPTAVALPAPESRPPTPSPSVGFFDLDDPSTDDQNLEQNAAADVRARSSTAPWNTPAQGGAPAATPSQRAAAALANATELGAKTKPSVRVAPRPDPKPDQRRNLTPLIPPGRPTLREMPAVTAEVIEPAPATTRGTTNANVLASLKVTAAGSQAPSDATHEFAALDAVQAAFAAERPRVVVHVPRKLVASPPAGLDSFSELVFHAVDGKRSMLAIASRVGSSPEEIDRACSALRALAAVGAIELASR